MGTEVSVTLWHTDAAAAERAIAAVMAEARRLDNTLSPYKTDSDLSRLNATAFGEVVPISAEMQMLIDKSLYYSRLSEGAFDISFASVGGRYDYREGRQPSGEQRRQLLPAIDYRLITLDRERRTLAFGHPDLRIDLGGIAKGYAVDLAARKLRQLGITHASVSAGGDSRVIGDKRGRPWMVGVKNPRARDRVAVLLPLSDAAVSTSGDYERYFIDQQTGERVHHILNPRTGRSATGIASVSVVGPRGFDTDPLSTTVFVLGVEKGLALLNRLKDFDGVIIDSAGKLHYSQGLMPPKE
nr:FAD:protein FMN transferase [Exilibacterium tricleocarpae]